MRAVGEFGGEQQRIGHFLARRPHAAGDVRGVGGERRFAFEALGAPQHLLRAAERALQFDLPARAFQPGAAVVDDELAGLRVLAAQIVRRAGGVQLAAAQLRQRQQRRGRPLRLRRRAGAHEAQSPAQLRRLAGEAETQRRAAVEQQRRHLAQRGRRGERLHVAVRQLRAVGHRRAQAGAAGSIEQCHAVAGLGQQVGGGAADDAGADHADARDRHERDTLR